MVNTIITNQEFHEKKKNRNKQKINAGGARRPNRAVSGLFTPFTKGPKSEKIFFRPDFFRGLPTARIRKGDDRTQPVVVVVVMLLARLVFGEPVWR
jgi:hypothetical protein